MLPQARERVVAAVEQVGGQQADVRGTYPYAETELQILEGLAEFGRALKPLFQALGQRLAHYGLQGSGHALAVLFPTFQAAVAHHQEHVEIVRGEEEAFAHDHLREHDPDRE